MQVGWQDEQKVENVEGRRSESSMIRGDSPRLFRSGKEGPDLEQSTAPGKAGDVQAMRVVRMMKAVDVGGLGHGMTRKTLREVQKGRGVKSKGKLGSQNGFGMKTDGRGR